MMMKKSEPYPSKNLILIVAVKKIVSYFDWKKNCLHLSRGKRNSFATPFLLFLL